MSTPVPGFDVRFPVSPPPQAPRPFGLFSHAVEGAGSPAPVNAPGDWERGVWYWSNNCNLKSGSLDGWCPTDDPSKPIDPYAPVRVEGTPFTVHSGQFCVLPTFDAEAEARAQLERGEQYRYEQVFWDQQQSRPDLVDLGTAPSEACGLGMLEAYAAEHYGARPVLHVPVSLMPLLMEHYLIREPVGDEPNRQRIFTRWGTPIVVGAGYPQGSPAQIMITGVVTMWRTDIFTNTHFDPPSNQQMAIAERSIVLTADCLAAVVTVPGCSGGE